MNLKSLLYIHFDHIPAFMQACEDYEVLIEKSEPETINKEPYHLFTLLYNQSEKMFCVGKRFQELSNAPSLIEKP